MSNPYFHIKFVRFRQRFSGRQKKFYLEGRTASCMQIEAIFKKIKNDRRLFSVHAPIFWHGIQSPSDGDLFSAGLQFFGGTYFRRPPTAKGTPPLCSTAEHRLTSTSVAASLLPPSSAGDSHHYRRLSQSAALPSGEVFLFYFYFLLEGPVIFLQYLSYTGVFFRSKKSMKKLISRWR